MIMRINYLDPATLGLNRTPTLLNAPDTSWKVFCGSKERRSPQWEEKATALLAYLIFIKLDVRRVRNRECEKEKEREGEWY